MTVSRGRYFGWASLFKVAPQGIANHLHGRVPNRLAVKGKHPLLCSTRRSCPQPGVTFDGNTGVLPSCSGPSPHLGWTATTGAGTIMRCGATIGTRQGSFFFPTQHLRCPSTACSYCHLLSGGMSNIAMTFGLGEPHNARSRCRPPTP